MIEAYRTSVAQFPARQLKKRSRLVLYNLFYLTHKELRNIRLSRAFDLHPTKIVMSVAILFCVGRHLNIKLKLYYTPLFKY